MIDWVQFGAGAVAAALIAAALLALWLHGRRAGRNAALQQYHPLEAPQPVGAAFPAPAFSAMPATERAGSPMDAAARRKALADMTTIALDRGLVAENVLPAGFGSSRPEAE